MVASTGQFYLETRKAAGQAFHGSTTANWNTDESDVVSLGAAGMRYKVHSLLLDISALVGLLTIRLYININGVERQAYSYDFSVAVDGPGLWLINGTIGIHDVLRVTAQSDNAADDGASVGYEYVLERM